MYREVAETMLRWALDHRCQLVIIFFFDALNNNFVNFSASSVTTMNLFAAMQFWPVFNNLARAA
jgi:hypothetical protein